jgi:hypothetical protein
MPIWHDGPMGQSADDRGEGEAGIGDGVASSELLKLDADAIHWRELNGEVIAIDLRNNQYLTINPSGVLLWPLLARGATLEQLSAALLGRWSLDPQRAHQDADRFVAWLREQRLLLTEARG